MHSIYTRVNSAIYRLPWYLSSSHPSFLSRFPAPLLPSLPSLPLPSPHITAFGLANILRRQRRPFRRRARSRRGRAAARSRGLPLPPSGLVDPRGFGDRRAFDDLSRGGWLRRMGEKKVRQEWEFVCMACLLGAARVRDVPGTYSSTGGEGYAERQLRCPRCDRLAAWADLSSWESPFFRLAALEGCHGGLSGL